MKQFLIVLIVVTGIGCAAAMPIIRGIVDIATLLCENAASEKPRHVLDNQTAHEWCRTQGNLQPFIDQILAAKQAASMKTGIDK